MEWWGWISSTAPQHYGNQGKYRKVRYRKYHFLHKNGGMDRNRDVNNSQGGYQGSVWSGGGGRFGSTFPPSRSAWSSTIFKVPLMISLYIYLSI